MNNQNKAKGNKMKASHDQFGEVQIQFNSQSEAIYSPDKKQKLLPCDFCGSLVWKPINVVSFLCKDCYLDYKAGKDCSGERRLS